MVFLTNDFGKCDTCNKRYVLGDRFNRCGDCGDCGSCCQHKQPPVLGEYLFIQHQLPVSRRPIANTEMKG